MRVRLDQKRRFWLLLVVISAIASMLRLAFLGSLPSGVYLDEAANVMDGFRALEEDGLA